MSLSQDGLAAGGLIGANSGQVTNCHTTGLVSGSDDYTGGLAGWNGSTITGCYSTCEIDGFYYNGGLVGFNSSTGNITNSYTRRYGQRRFIHGRPGRPKRRNRRRLLYNRPDAGQYSFLCRRHFIPTPIMSADWSDITRAPCEAVMPEAKSPAMETAEPAMSADWLDGTTRAKSFVPIPPACRQDTPLSADWSERQRPAAIYEDTGNFWDTEARQKQPARWAPARLRPR